MLIELASTAALFHTPGNAGELAERLSELIENPSLRRALGSEGREAAGRLFSRTRLSEALIPIYEHLARN